MYFRPFLGAPCHSIYDDRLGAHLCRVPCLTWTQMFSIFVGQIIDPGPDMAIHLHHGPWRKRFLHSRGSMVGNVYTWIATRCEVFQDLSVPCSWRKRREAAWGIVIWILPSSKLTWQWNITIFNRKYIFKGSIFHCHVSLPEGSWHLFFAFVPTFYYSWPLFHFSPPFLSLATSCTEKFMGVFGEGQPGWAANLSTETKKIQLRDQLT